MGWTEFIIAFAVFFASHSIPVRPPVRQILVGRLGARGFGMAYSALSIGVLAWLIGAAGRAPYVPLWSTAGWQTGLALAAMALVCAVLAFTLGRPNQFSFGGARNDRFDPARPGIIRWTRHPILVALAIWAAAHALVNGDLAHVLLFGTFFVFALIGQKLVDRRKQRELGEDWVKLVDVVAQAPRLSRISGEELFRAAMAVVLYGGLLAVHPLFFGVSPIP